MKGHRVSGGEKGGTHHLEVIHIYAAPEIIVVPSNRANSYQKSDPQLGELSFNLGVFNFFVRKLNIFFKNQQISSERRFWKHQTLN